MEGRVSDWAYGVVRSNYLAYTCEGCGGDGVMCEVCGGDTVQCYRCRVDGVRG